MIDRIKTLHVSARRGDAGAGNFRGNRTMKVGYVLKCYPRLSQTFIVNELLAHQRSGLDIEIFSLRPPRDEPRHANIARVRAPVTCLPPAETSAAEFWAAAGELVRRRPLARAALAGCHSEPAAEVFQALVVARLALERGVTHLHAHFGNLTAAVARLAAAFAGLPYSFTAHAIDIFHEKVRPEILRRKLADAEGVVTVSDFNLRYLRQHYDGAAAGVRRIYNGLDLAEFTYAAPHDRSPQIVAVGRLVEKKGFPDLIDACAELKRGDRKFHCVIVGNGPLEARLRAQVHRLGLGEHVELAGLRTQDEVKRLIQSAACVAAPCVVGDDGDMDGLPTVILETMALGTPCVATDVTGIPEVLHHGETGLGVPQHAPPALAEALDRLLTDPALRLRLAERARALMTEQFDIDRNTARLRALFAGSA